MKSRIGTVLFALALMLSCSKSSDPQAKAGGCSFTFKGKTYTSPVASCDGKQLSSTGSGGTTGIWVIAVQPANKILGFDDGSSASSYTNANTTVQITKSGTTVSFNGVVGNDDGDSGTINGKCTCSTGSI